eukprot:2099439-Pyramimonas_sp.AAC.1
MKPSFQGMGWQGSPPLREAASLAQHPMFTKKIHHILVSLPGQRRVKQSSNSLYCRTPARQCEAQAAGDGDYSGASPSLHPPRRELSDDQVG